MRSESSDFYNYNENNLLMQRKIKKKKRNFIDYFHNRRLELTWKENFKEADERCSGDLFLRINIEFFLSIIHLLTAVTDHQKPCKNDYSFLCNLRIKFKAIFLGQKFYFLHENLKRKVLHLPQSLRNLSHSDMTRKYCHVTNLMPGHTYPVGTREIFDFQYFSTSSDP